MFIIIWKNDLMSIIVWKNIVYMSKIDTMSLIDNEGDDDNSDDDAVFVKRSSVPGILIYHLIYSLQQCFMEAVNILLLWFREVEEVAREDNDFTLSSAQSNPCALLAISVPWPLLKLKISLKFVFAFWLSQTQI